MTGDDRAALRYAVASTEETGLWFNRHTAYTGPHLLVIADGVQHRSSPGRPSVIAVEELRQLDVPVDASSLAATLERGIEGLRETFRGLLAGDPSWDMTGEPTDITPHEAAIGDRYVLCTDGIDRMMPPGTLRDILRDTASDPQDIADELAGIALPAKTYHQFTCIVADVVAQPR
jgi:hypothetical protein